MESILKDWGRVFRFILIIVTIVYLSTFLVKRFLNGSEVSLEFSDNKTIVKVKSNGVTTTQSLLAASDCWVETGIVIKPGESYKIKVTGKIHTAADYLLRDVSNDTIPLFQWSGPDGREFRIRDKTKFEKFDQLRKGLLIDPNANIGCVLFYFQDENQPKPSCDGDKNFNPRPQNLVIYNNNKGILEGKNNGNISEILWAPVNDMLIIDTTEDIKSAYLGGDLHGDTLTKKSKKWEGIKMSGYRKLWFDDNIGNYIVSVQIKE